MPAAEYARFPNERLRRPETAENVEALLESVRYLLTEESERDQSFNTRGVGVAGFVAIVLSLSSTLGHDALSSGWGQPWRAIGVALLAGALLALLASAVVVVMKVLRPQEAASMGIDEIEKYPLPEYVYTPRIMNQGRIMRGLVEILLVERSRGRSKAAGLRWSYGLLLAGLVCISMLGFLLGLHDAKLIGVRHARREQQRAIHAHDRSGDHADLDSRAAAQARAVAVSNAHARSRQTGPR